MSVCGQRIALLYLLHTGARSQEAVKAATISAHPAEQGLGQPSHQFHCVPKFDSQQCAQSIQAEWRGVALNTLEGRRVACERTRVLCYCRNHLRSLRRVMSSTCVQAFSQGKERALDNFPRVSGTCDLRALNGQSESAVARPVLAKGPGTRRPVGISDCSKRAISDSSGDRSFPRRPAGVINGPVES
jgi:hypothetical protein